LTFAGYDQSNYSKRDEMAREYNTRGGDEKYIQSFHRISRRSRWKDNIKMHLKEIGWEDKTLIDLGQGLL
jgi:hypothetical protein